MIRGKFILTTTKITKFAPFAMLMLLCTAVFAQNTFTDSRDGKKYKITKIGEQTWMAQNLNYDAKGSKCYDNIPANCEKYGRLYDRDAVKNACPKGWHLPSGLEWNFLYKYIGGDVESKLKAKNGWDDYNSCEYECELAMTGGSEPCDYDGDESECKEAMKSGNGEDKYGFSALPGGFGYPSVGNFVGSGYSGFWWCALKGDSDGVCLQKMGYFTDGDGDFARDVYYYKLPGFSFSVRCVQDYDKDALVDFRDGKKYKSVKIGEQTWMAQNLDYNAEGSKCYDNKLANCEKYGRLYNWEDAMQACPDGWHLPDYDEWQTLAAFTGGKEIAGQKLKAKNGWEKWDCEWTEIDDRGRTTKRSKCNSDNYGFSALPGGWGGSNGSFGFVGRNGIWWSANEYFIYDTSRLLGMRHDLEYTIDDGGIPKSHLLSVRCLKGEKNNAKDIDKVLKNVAGLQTSSKTELHGRRGSATGGFNEDYTEGGSGGTGGIGTKTKGSLIPPSARDIDMGSGDGSRSKAEIMAVVNARMPGLRNVYNKYLKLKPGFSGKVTLKFTIAPRGDIVSITIMSSTTNYAEFDSTVKNMVATWKWKALKSGDTTPTIPFNFTE
jgi:TonB family protein